MRRRLGKENGSITVEATISLTAFMFAIITILTMVNICVAQARIGYALNTVARELSQYSYLYSLTGLNDRQSEIYESGKNNTEAVTNSLSNLNTAYNEMNKLGNATTEIASSNNIDDIMKAWDGAVGNVKNIQEAGSSLYEKVKEIAKDPKSVMFGIAKLASSKTFDLAKSRLVAAPLTKVMIKKHLVNEKNGDIDSYLKFLGVVPASNGKYFDGLNFNGSTIFPNGSSEIKLNVRYDIKVIPLLPNLDFKFHFEQSAITHGWFCGDVNFTPAKKFVKNNNIWTKATVHERSTMIQTLVTKDLGKEGYKKISDKGMNTIQLYHPEKNEFVAINSMNPLYSPDGKSKVGLEDISDIAVQRQIESMCSNVLIGTQNRNTVTIKNEVDGVSKKLTYNCSNSKKKVVLVIPEDKGLKDKMLKILKNCNTNGVEVQIETSFGNGQFSTEVTTDVEGKTK